jgi:hypothetical protein
MGGIVKAEGIGDGLLYGMGNHRQAAIDDATRKHVFRVEDADVGVARPNLFDRACLDAFPGVGRHAQAAFGRGTQYIRRQAEHNLRLTAPSQDIHWPCTCCAIRHTAS